jgi:hypothetical protein
MKDLFGREVDDRPKLRGPDRAHPAPVGSGPAGETCGTCKSYCSVEHHNKRWRKCRLVRWTHGPGTDIRKRDPACAGWEQKEGVES